MLDVTTQYALKTLAQENPAIYKQLVSMFNNNQKDLSYAAHEIGNYVSFLYSAHQLLEYQQPELADNPLWKDMTATYQSLNHFLDRTSIYRNSYKKSPKQILLNDLLYGLPDLLDDADYSYDNEFIFDIDSTDIWIFADATKLSTALYELLTNACEAAPTRSAITICCHKCTNDRAQIEIKNTRNENNNASIQINELLTPFYTTKDDCHLGLGLSIVTNICAAHAIEFTLTQTQTQTTAALVCPVL